MSQFPQSQVQYPQPQGYTPQGQPQYPPQNPPQNGGWQQPQQPQQQQQFAPPPQQQFQQPQATTQLGYQNVCTIEGQVCPNKAMPQGFKFSPGGNGKQPKLDVNVKMRKVSTYQQVERVSVSYVRLVVYGPRAGQMMNSIQPGMVLIFTGEYNLNTFKDTRTNQWVSFPQFLLAKDVNGQSPIQFKGFAHLNPEEKSTPKNYQQQGGGQQPQQNFPPQQQFVPPPGQPQYPQPQQPQQHWQQPQQPQQTWQPPQVPPQYPQNGAPPQFIPPTGDPNQQHFAPPVGVPQQQQPQQQQWQPQQPAPMGPPPGGAPGNAPFNPADIPF